MKLPADFPQNEEDVRVEFLTGIRFHQFKCRIDIIGMPVNACLGNGAIGACHGQDLCRKGDFIPFFPAGIAAAVPVFVVVVGDVNGHLEEVVIIPGVTDILKDFRAHRGMGLYDGKLLRQKGFLLLQDVRGNRHVPQIA